MEHLEIGWIAVIVIGELFMKSQNASSTTRMKSFMLSLCLAAARLPYAAE